MVMTSTGTPMSDFEQDSENGLSKTRKKRNMHELQALGESLIGIGETKLKILQLPEKLFDAIIAAGKIRARGARSRQCQYIGKLMRNVDSEPIKKQLDLWDKGLTGHEGLHHQAEKIRDRLMLEADYLDEFLCRFVNLDKDMIKELIAKSIIERAEQRPPVAYRKLFRIIRDSLIESA